MRIVVVNKSDLPRAWRAAAAEVPLLEVSALTGARIDDLRRQIVAAVAGSDAPRDLPAITNMRHVELLTRARDALDRAAAAAADRVPEEFVLADLNEARTLLEEVTGGRTPDDVLGHIFAAFCIGK